jgi:hypothetical protein
MIAPVESCNRTSRETSRPLSEGGGNNKQQWESDEPDGMRRLPKTNFA